MLMFCSWFWQAISTQRATIHSTTAFHNKVPGHRSWFPVFSKAGSLQCLSKQINGRRCKAANSLYMKPYFQISSNRLFPKRSSQENGAAIYLIQLSQSLSWFAILINAVLASALEKLTHRNMTPYRKLLLIMKTFQKKKRIAVTCANPLSCGINETRNTIHKNWIGLYENNVWNCKNNFWWHQLFLIVIPSR